MRLFEGRWYLGGVASGVLLMLTFYPFYIWPLAFVALTPLALLVASGLGAQRVFLSGCIAFGMLVFEVSFLMVAEFHWLPGSPLFIGAIRYGGVAAAVVLFGGLFASWSLALVWLRGRSFLVYSSTAALLYALAERIAELPVGGYYIPTLSLVVPLHVGFVLAAAGGALFVSAVLVWVNLALAEVMASWRTPRRGVVIKDLMVMLVLLLLVYVGSSWYVGANQGEGERLSVATLQIASREDRSFATTTASGRLMFPALTAYIMKAQGADIIIYPDSIVPRVIREGDSSVGELVRAVTPHDVTLVTWDNREVLGRVYTGFHFWREGGEVGSIEKKSLVPFKDYAPRWARYSGFYSAPFDVVPGGGGGALVGPVSLGGVVCSEIHRPSRAREEARRSSLIIAAGSEAMFEDDVASRFSLQAARYRAAENNVPIVRASLLGPSAIINADGSLVAYLPFGEGGVLRGEVEVREKHVTLYTHLGDTPYMIVLTCLLLAAAKTRFLGRKE